MRHTRGVTSEPAPAGRLPHRTRQFGPVTVAWTPISTINQVRPAAFEALSEPERARIETMADDRADAFLLSRYLLRTVASERGAAPRAQDVIVTATCTHCGGSHGRPQIDGFHASISHADGLAFIAIAPSETVASLGIDTESAVALDSSQELLEWVSREAVLKADGRGLRGRVHVHLDVEVDGGSAVVMDTGNRYELTRVWFPRSTTILAIEHLPS